MWGWVVVDMDYLGTTRRFRTVELLVLDRVAWVVMVAKLAIDRRVLVKTGKFRGLSAMNQVV
jgi:hypothetical protein